MNLRGAFVLLEQEAVSHDVALRTPRRYSAARAVVDAQDEGAGECPQSQEV